MRAFVAVEMDQGILRQVSPIQRRLADPDASVKWVDPRRMHLTLKFLGEIDPRTVPAVADAMREAASGVEPFEISVGGLGSFPADRSPRVIWLGVRDASGQLAALAAGLEQRLAAAGFPAEGRAFRPHLTLGRVRSRRGADKLLVRLGAQGSPELGTQFVEEVVLFESQLTRGGPIYSRLATQPLGAPPASNC